jgi:hypothetical protein
VLGECNFEDYRNSGSLGGGDTHMTPDVGLRMTTSKRWFLGLCSTLLLAVGFARAADVLDPMSRELAAMHDGTPNRPISVSEDCGSICDIAND